MNIWSFPLEMRAETHIGFHVVSDGDESWNVPRNDEKSFRYEIVVTRGRTDGRVDGRKRVSASFRWYTRQNVTHVPLRLLRPRPRSNSREFPLFVPEETCRLFGQEQA